MSVQKKIKELLRLGYTKVAIAKKCGVEWQTVNLWSKGTFIPENKSKTIKQLSQLWEKGEIYGTQKKNRPTTAD